MRHEFRLADIGEGLEEAEIIRWLVNVGDHVTRDQPLIEVMTDKSNAELPAPASGRVVQLGGAVGDMVTVGELIAVIEEADAVAPDAVAPGEMPPAAVPRVTEPLAVPSPGVAATTSPPVSAASASLPPAVSIAPVGHRPKASPSTRRQALSRGIDLGTLIGSGPGGRILLSDLDAGTPLADPAVDQASTLPLVSTFESSPVAAVAPAPVPPVDPTFEEAAQGPVAAPQEIRAGSTVPLRGVRRAIAQNMTRSWSEIPHIHAFRHTDAEPMLSLRERLRATNRPAYDALTPLSFFVAAVARAVRDHSQANASIDMAAESITYHPDINIGVAVAAPQGLVVPVLRSADQLDFETLSLTLGQLVRGAREGTLGREHFQGGTVTITNFGSLGGEQATPLLRPPESLIVGFGSIAPRPYVIDDQVVARRTMHIVAGADHRLLDGDVVTALLGQVAASLTDPLQLVI